MEKNCCYKWLIEKGNLKWCLMFFVTASTLLIVYNQRKSPLLYLSHSRFSSILGVRQKNTGVSLDIIKAGEAPAHDVEITIIIPIINNSNWKIGRSRFCEVEKLNDSLMIVNLINRAIYPTDEAKHSLYFFFTDTNAEELKKSGKSLKYTIKCKEKTFSNTISLSDIFSEYFP
jgi:hypothetical protein